MLPMTRKKVSGRGKAPAASSAGAKAATQATGSRGFSTSRSPGSCGVAFVVLHAYFDRNKEEEIEREMRRLRAGG